MRLTLASGVTLFRLFLLFPALYYLINDQRLVALGFLVAVLVGDVLDGVIARLRHEETSLGKVLDPVVDKIVFISVLAALVWTGDLPWLTLAAVLLLQITIVIGAFLWMREQKKPPSARPLGKAASFLLSAGLLMAILHPVIQLQFYPWVVYGSLVLMYIAGVDYLIKLIEMLRERSPKSDHPRKAQIQPEKGR